MIAHACFKYGALHASHWLACFVGGNVTCVIGIWLLMQLYQRLSADLVLSITVGGSFLLVQCMMALVFHTQPTPLQWAGFAAVSLGMMAATLGGGPADREPSPPATPKDTETALVSALQATTSEKQELRSRIARAPFSHSTR